MAASRGQAETIQVLIDYGADVQGPTEGDDWTPLVFAAYRGHLDAVRVLVDHGAGVTEADGNPIHFAGQRKHKELCRFLVAHGAVDDLVTSSDDDEVQLFRASYAYDAETVDQLLEVRPELVHCRDRKGRTALHEASTQGDTKTVRVLLKYGAELTILDDGKQSPLDRAVSHRQHAVVKILQKHEATLDDAE